MSTLSSTFLFIIQWQRSVSGRFWVIESCERNFFLNFWNSELNSISPPIPAALTFICTTLSNGLSWPFSGSLRASYLLPRGFSVNLRLEVIPVDTMHPSGTEKRAALCRVWTLVVALLVCATSVNGCPHKCSCSGSHVDCQGLGLKTVPKGIPRNAERL